MKVDFSRFEPLAGARPRLVVARHPAGGLLALQTLSEVVGVAPALGIWEEATGALVWRYAGAAGLAWTADGNQLLVWTLPAADGTLVVGTPGCFERRRWPADELLSACTFALPMIGNVLCEPSHHRDSVLISVSLLPIGRTHFAPGDILVGFTPTRRSFFIVLLPCYHCCHLVAHFVGNGRFVMRCVRSASGRVPTCMAGS